MVISRVSSLTLRSREMVPLSLGYDYSRMKHGDPLATKALAEILFHNLSTSNELNLERFKKKNFVLISSAYGNIPTAAHSLMLEFSKLLTREGIQHEVAAVTRLQSLNRVDYATLSDAGREVVLKNRKLTINNKNRLLMNNRPLIVIDDLFATGRHERAMINSLLDNCIVPEVNFFYVLEFSEELRNSNPMFESELNLSHVKDLDNLLNLIRESNEPSYINARVVKFVLAEGERNQKLLQRFLMLAPIEYLERLYEAVMSDDMLLLRGFYSNVVKMLCICVRESRLRNVSTCSVTR